MLAKAQWRILDVDLQLLRRAVATGNATDIQRWRTERRLPQFFALVDADNHLVVDLENTDSLAMFSDYTRNRDHVTLVELLPGPTSRCVEGPTGPLANELIVPFIRKAPRSPRHSRANPITAPSGTRRCIPGSEWIYFKLYTGSGSIERVVIAWWHNVVAPLRAQGLIDDAFFLRYADPHRHVRLRLRCADGTKIPQTLTHCFAFADHAQRLGLVWRVVLDTYVREVERYGGPTAIAHNEHIFSLDSDYAASLLAQYAGDAGAQLREGLILRTLDTYLEVFGIPIAERLSFVRRVARKRATFPEAPPKDELAIYVRRNRDLLAGVLAGRPAESSGLLPGLDALQRLRHLLTPAVEQLRALRDDNRLSEPLSSLIESLIHVSVNRVARNEPNQWETRAYHCLARVYDSFIARSSKTTQRADTGLAGVLSDAEHVPSDSAD